MAFMTHVAERGAAVDEEASERQVQLAEAFQEQSAGVLRAACEVVTLSCQQLGGAHNVIIKGVIWQISGFAGLKERC